MSRRQLVCFRWNGTEWAPVTSPSHPQPTSGEPVRIATLNILADCFPWYVKMAIRSADRYAWLCDGIRRLNPTLLGLNEVTSTALRQLQRCPFIRENYFLTECATDSDGDQPEPCANGLCWPHGTILLSKLPLLDAFALPLARSRRQAVVGRIQLGADLVHVCAFHVRSQQTPRNAEIRARQIRDIARALQPLGCPFALMGDFNLHYLFEDAVVIDNQLIDAWAQTHYSALPPFNDGQPGYTFDAVDNTFVPCYIPGERRRMRLDRILFSCGFPAFAIGPCALWANEPIQSGSYLFPSDHFGLSIDLRVDATNENGPMISIGQPDANAEEILHRNAQNNADRTPYRLQPMRTTWAFTAHAVWLGAVALGLK